ncbi:hypothetical protein AGMMS50276_09340 [Synergistales bacterium]|nr:hypothetical protein AGMMS50276_09340 [Synergistales bacterium]
MKNKICFALLLLAAVICAPSLSAAGVRQERGMYIVDDAEGYAPVKNNNKNAARDEAKRVAYSDALEKALGAMVTGVTQMENFEVVRDKVFSQTNGLVKKFDITREWVDKDGLLHLTAKCAVAAAALDGVLGPAIIDIIGNPRVMILIDERIGDQQAFISSAEAETLRVFEKAGYLIVDPDQARALINIDLGSAYNDPSKILDAARTLRAEVIILGKAIGAPFRQGKIEGITMFGVRGAVQLKAVLTKTAYQIGSKTIEKTTGKKPSLTVEDGANRCFNEAAAEASKEIVHKIAYALVSGSPGGVPGITVNIKIAKISFKGVEYIEEILKELAGKGGGVYERDYSNNVLEVDVNSEKNARAIASTLSYFGLEINGLTQQTINATIPDVAPPEPKPEPEVTVAEGPKWTGMLPWPWW